MTNTANVIEGLIPFLGGVYGLLLANGALPRNPKDPAKLEQFRANHAKKLNALCPFLMFMGVLKMLGVY